MSTGDLAFTSASDLKQLIDSKQVSIVELTEMFLRRIEALNPTLNAYLTVVGEEALASAQVADKAVLRGEAKGLLHGIPISIKDLEMTRGIRTTMGSLVFKDNVPDQDNCVVERIRKSGAVILGKTNAPEFGAYGQTENKLGAPARNPWDPDRTTGASSGGAAAAVVAGLCTLAQGSDGGGSIRNPSSFCGNYGFKPSQGRVPSYSGVTVVERPPYRPFGQPGPMTRTVRDGALLLRALAGPDSRDPGCIRSEPPDFVAALDQGVKGLRIAWSSDLGYAPVDPEVVDITSRAAGMFEDLGCTVEEPGITLEDPWPAYWEVISVNIYTSFGYLLETRSEDLTDYCRALLERGREISAADYSRALHFLLSNLKARVEALFDQYDLLLTPSTAVPAFPHWRPPTIIGGQPVSYAGFSPFTPFFNLTGQPAANAPCGFSSEGLPIGLHIAGRMGEETTVLRASAAFEEACGGFTSAVPDRDMARKK